MLSFENHKELEDNGFTVVPNVLEEKECDDYIDEYRSWFGQFKDGDWPRSKSSLIFGYNIGNLDVTWKIRMKTKPIFAQVWKTDKLLSSVDAIAIGRPPENGQEWFATEGDHWLHTDQSAARIGLHAYQSAVYLEEADRDDWTFHLMKGSHKFMQEFYDTHQKQAFKSSFNDYLQLRDEDVTWFLDKGCDTIRISVPKGGMVLWDSRLIHANARPISGRTHANRWRYTVFVCMNPAIWVTEEDLAIRKEVYKNACMTTHWPTQGVRCNRTITEGDSIKFPTEIPPTGKTQEAKRLWGVLPYNFNDGKPNGPVVAPEFDQRYKSIQPPFATSQKMILRKFLMLGAGVVALGVAFVLMKYKF